MKHTARYITLQSVVDNYISESHQTEAQYLRLWHLAVRGLQEIGLAVGNDPITRKLGVLPNKTVELPGDYLDWFKIGVLNDKGEVATLRHNEDLTKYGSIDGSRLSINTGDTKSIYDSDNVLWRNYWNDNTFFNLLGASSGTENLGEFAIDSINGVIILDKDYRFDHVILEYKSSPTHNSDFHILAQLQEVVIAWLAWKDIASLPSGRRANNGTVRQREDFYHRMLKTHMKYVNPFRLSEFNDVIRLGQKLAVKH